MFGRTKLLAGVRTLARRIVYGPPRPASMRDKAELLARLLTRNTNIELAQRVLATNRFLGTIPPDLRHSPEGRRILVLAAHQDDEIIGAGGVLLHALKSGAEVQPIYLTDGASPKFTGDHRESYIRRRREEAERVWREMGGNPPIFMNWAERKINLQADNVHAVRDAIVRYSPDCLMLPFLLERPEDHYKISHLVCLGHRVAPLPEIEVWSYQITGMVCHNVVVDITDVTDRKNALMEMWESQNRVFNWAHYTRGLNAANTILAQTLIPGGVQRYVEVFYVAPMSSFAELVEFYLAGTPSTGQTLVPQSGHQGVSTPDQ